MNSRKLSAGWRWVCWVVLISMTAWSVRADEIVGLLKPVDGVPAGTAPGRPVTVDVESGAPRVAAVDAVLFRSMEVLELSRAYIQGLPAHGLGEGWRLSCDEQVIRLPDGGAKIVGVEGETEFGVTSPGVWTSKQGIASTLRKSLAGYVWDRPGKERRLYDGDGWLVRQELPQGGFSVERDATRLAVAVRDLSGKRLSLQSEGGRYRSLTDPAGGVWAYRYDGKGRLTDVIRPARGPEHYGYNDQDLLSLVDVGYGRIELTYDASKRVVRQSSAGTVIEQRSYTERNGEWEVQVQSYPGRTSLFSRSRDRRQYTLVDESGTRMTAALDARGQLLTVAVDGKMVATGTTDSQGWYQSVLAGGTTVAFSYVDGLLAKLASPPQDGVTLQYDKAGRLTTMKGPGIGVIEWQWNDAGQCVHATGVKPGAPVKDLRIEYAPNGTFSAMVFDGRKTEFTSDALGRVRSIAVDGQKMDLAYDAESYPVSLDPGNGKAVTIRYDARGLPLSFGGAAGEATLSYALDGSLTAMKDMAGGKIGIKYDTFGRLAEIANQAGRVFSLEHDAKGRLVKRQSPGGAVETFAYGEGDQLREFSRPDARLAYTYNAAGKPVLIDGGSLGSVKYTYAADGQLKGWVDSAGESFEQGDEGVVYRTAGASAEVVVNSKPEAGGTVQTVAVKGQDPVRRFYDATGRLVRIESPAGKFLFAYDQQGRRTSLVFPNGLATAYTYDALGRLTVVSTSDAQGRIVERRSYTYDPRGICSRMESADGTVLNYEYDQAGRLTRVANGQGVELERYAYDPSGNRTLATAQPGGAAVKVTSDDQGRLAQQGQTTFAYDRQGRRVSEAAGNGPAREFAYDGLDRLIGVKVGETGVTHGYSLLGHRLWSQVQGGPRRYYLNLGDYVIAETDAQGKVQASYLYGDRTDEMLAAKDASGKWSYFLRDGLQSLRAVTDGTGKTVARVDYTAFGVPTDGPAGCAYLFAGREWDPISRTYFNRARHYDPATGQFLTVDPLAADGGLNPYAYAANDPVQFRDASGTAIPLAIIGGYLAWCAVGAVIDYAAQKYIAGKEDKDISTASIILSGIATAVGVKAGLALAEASWWLAAGAAAAISGVKTALTNLWDRKPGEDFKWTDVVAAVLLSFATAGLFERFLSPLFKELPNYIANRGISEAVRRFFQSGADAITIGRALSEIIKNLFSNGIDGLVGGTYERIKNWLAGTGTTPTPVGAPTGPLVPIGLGPGGGSSWVSVTPRDYGTSGGTLPLPGEGQTPSQGRTPSMGIFE